MILRLSTGNEALGDMDLSGNMTRQIEQDMPVQDDSSHVINVGKLVEDMELKMRNLLRSCTPNHVKPQTASFQSDITQRKFTLEKPKMLWETFEVQFYHLSSMPYADMAVGIPPLTEAAREKATHQEMINSMKR